MKLEKIVKKLGQELIDEMDSMPVDQLEKVIVNGENAIAEATEQRDANEKYKAARTAVKDLSAGLKEVKGFQSAKIQYALMRLKEMGAK